jgi:hypothetical protein
MDLITLDFETYYSKQYSLSKLTTEEYIRDPQFQVIGVSTKLNDEEPVWVTGKASEVLAHLRPLPWENAIMLCQNTMFDGAIMTWRCGIRPKVLADTMLMSRAIYGVGRGVPQPQSHSRAARYRGQRRRGGQRVG